MCHATYASLRLRSTAEVDVRAGGFKSFWQEGGGHDLNIWSMKKAIKKTEYRHHRNSPARAIQASLVVIFDPLRVFGENS
jgi:hypothetical protein